MNHSQNFFRIGLLSIATLVAACSASAPSDAEKSEDQLRGGGTHEPPIPILTFLDAAEYDQLLKIDPTFPFGVIGKHAAGSGAVLGARWGRHNGPSVTTGGAAKVFRFKTDGLAATDPVTSTSLNVAAASGLPAQRFWSADGLVDLSFGDGGNGLAMQAYTTSSANFDGELLFFKGDYSAVVGRANVNGFYSGVGLSSAGKSRIVYSGLSTLSTSASTTNASGLYASDLCNDSLVPSTNAACAAPFKLFGWNGYSGPVAKDAAGNVFVSAFLSQALPSGSTDVVYALTGDESFSQAALTPSSVAEAKTSGTASLAAAMAPAGDKGWLLGKGYDAQDPAPVWAQRYTYDTDVTPAKIVADGAPVANALTPANNAASLSLFANESNGHLWVALETPNDGSFFFELAPKL